MEYVEKKRKNDMKKLYMQINTAKDKRSLDNIADLYIGNSISEEVLLEYLKINLSYPKILDRVEINSTNFENKSCMKYMPLLSVIIPTHGNGLCIGQAIDSVLCQTYKNIEIIILDDKENFIKKDFILRKYKSNKKIKYYQSRNGKKTGPEKRKAGFYKANGEYIIFLDHDDFYLDSLFFERAVSFFEKTGTDKRKQKEVFSCYASNALEYFEDTNSYEIKKLNVSGSYSGKEYLYGIQLKYNKPLSLFPAVFVKKKINNYSKSIILEDSCIYMLACLSGNIFISDNVCGAYRIGNGNYTKTLHFELIIPVLEAKRRIAEKAKKIYGDKNWDKWLLKQVEGSLNYSYKSGIPTTYKDLFLMELWGFLHCKSKFINAGKYYLAQKIMEGIQYSFSNTDVLQKKLERMNIYYKILNLWIINKNMGNNVDNYFIRHNFKKVSIYGYGEIGKRIFEELSQSKDIEVVSIIDNSFTKNELNANELFYMLNDELPETDIVVITPVFAFKNIEKDLKKRGINNCISIEDIFIKF